MKYRNENRKIPALWLALGCFVLAFLLSQGQLQKKREDLADRLSLHVLRFHVLANSDSASDQAVKLEMRSLILDYIQQLLPRNADKEETAACLSNYQNDIEAYANDLLEKKGFGYRLICSSPAAIFPPGFTET